MKVYCVMSTGVDGPGIAGVFDSLERAHEVCVRRNWPVKCPMCHGVGGKGHFMCVNCRGKGTVSYAYYEVEELTLNEEKSK